MIRKIFSSFETMAFVSNPRVPDTRTMVKMTKTMVDVPDTMFSAVGEPAAIV